MNSSHKHQVCLWCAGVLIVAFNPLFKLSESHLPGPVILFTTIGGLRGAVSLILAQMLVSQQDQQQKSRDMLQTAQVSYIHNIYIYIYIYLSILHMFSQP